ncbi:MAG: hypothetical protein ACPLXM_06705 [Bacteroidales bacterium]
MKASGPNALFHFIIGIFWLTSCSHQPDYFISYTEKSSPLEMTGAREIRRYLYLRTDVLPSVSPYTSIQDSRKNFILVTTADHIPSSLSVPDSLRAVLASLQPQEYKIITLKQPAGNKVLLLCGADSMAALYACYHFIETLGVRFFLHGDVIPDNYLSFSIPDLNLTAKPSFALRGILPFHDFPEGPDWWDEDEYKTVIGQLAKMRMNFIGFHTYPESDRGPYKAEPIVWIGLPEDIQEDGNVLSAYPVLHFNTGDSTWGYRAKPTSSFSFGSANLFGTDVYGASYMRNVSPWPHTDEENVSIFNDLGAIQSRTFSFARKLGVRVCIGTETPLTVPGKVREKLKNQGKHPDAPESILALYKGIFTRLKILSPPDYYWLWTPESWTWEGETKEQVKKTVQDIQLALAALKESQSPFTLATCGWVLGPSSDRILFDKILPQSMPFSCINRDVGFSPVEPGFARISNRPKWQISWLEDDPALVSPQLWAGRVRKDAADALKYGCTGLMGIHWRTKTISPALEALAKAGWEAAMYDTTPLPGGRDLNTGDFYTNWAQAMFGEKAAQPLGNFFARLDGGPFHKENTERKAYLPRTSDWTGGPGGIRINYAPWDSVKKSFLFVEEFEQFRPLIRGKSSMEQFEYWRNMFLYARAQARVGCLLGEMDRGMQQLLQKSSPEVQQAFLFSLILPLRDSLKTAWSEMMHHLLLTVGTTGELGTIANLEMHNLGRLKLLSKYDPVLDSLFPGLVPPIQFPTGWDEEPRIIVTANRNLLEASENFHLRVRVLARNPVEKIDFYWRPIGQGKFRKAAFTFQERQVFELEIPAGEINGVDFEYYVKVKVDNKVLYWPVTARERNATVVVF